MIKDDEIHIFPCQLDPSLTTMIVYPGSSKYEKLKDQFQESGHAFILHQLKMIVIDGAVVIEPWFTIDHLMVIQAHELAHFRAGHAIEENIQDHINIEKEADWLGRMLLKSHGHSSAFDLHTEEYVERYETNPDLDSVMFEKKLGKFIH